MSKTRTIAVTGASEQDATRITSLLERHRHKLSHPWESGAAADADLLLVDIESTYGQMDWLRARSRGRLVIAYTSAAEPLEPEFSLRKPVVSGELVALLNRFGAGINGAKAEAAAPMQPANAETYDASSAPVAANATKPSAITVERPVQIVASMPPKMDPPRSQACFIDELLGALDATEGPLRLVHEGLPSIIVDPARQRWYAGVGGLKPLAGWSRHPLCRDQLIHLDTAEFANATEIMSAQPYSRLIWFARLTRSEGTLDPGLPRDARYRLTRWPLVEREFPKHFRIATQMMRGTGTIQEIAVQSTAGIADVVDFINAYNALGYVECQAMLPVTAPNDRSGLLERVRKSLRN